jgi:hypothetical protein
MRETRKLTVADVEWALVAEPEDCPVKGNALASGDDAEDKAAEDAILADLESGNQWAWCHVVLTGSFKHLKTLSMLGCCSYSGEDDFKAEGGPYQDMKSEVLQELQVMAEDLCEWLE